MKTPFELRRRWSVFAFAVIVLTFGMTALAPLARADGVVIVEPPICDPACPGPVNLGQQLDVRTHKVDVTIDNQVATTTIDQVFHNPNDWIAEGTYVFPIPAGATVDKFTMFVDGEPVEAKILTAEEARQIYDDIVRRMRDPALLEYAGQGAIQASIFPIEPGGDRRVQIEYNQVLTADQGLIRYVYPLNTERFSAAPLESVSVRVQIASADPIRAIYSPSHDIAIDREDDLHAVAGWESSLVKPDTDFELIYTVSQHEIGANLLSYLDPTTGEGTFMLLAAPGIDAARATVAKDVIVVLDTSGSMEGDKIVQAKEAVSFVLGHLNAEDRFNVVEFSTGVRTYASDLRPQSDAVDAASWVGGLTASGGTDINQALLDAVSMAGTERPTYVIFLTDGLPTEGETETQRILANVGSSAPDNVRLFAFGVGDDVETVLLDSLVNAHHGASSYVRPGEQIDEEVSGFYAKISTPVLTDIELTIDGVKTEELYPNPLPDLFAGTQLVVLGRYGDAGTGTVTLTGKVNGETKTFTFASQPFVGTGGGVADDYLPRLWATRKIGYLLTQIRINGASDELVQAVVDLSVRYGIVTPYTSYLITEDDILSQQGRAGAAESAKQSADGAAASGNDAVEEADAIGVMSGQGAGSSSGESGAAAPVSTITTADGGSVFASDVVKQVGSHAFVLQNGVWIETSVDPATATTIKVQFGSDDYFTLLTLRPDLADAFALGSQVIATSGDLVFEVTADAQPAIDFSAL